MFDNDGVLVDTEELYFAANREALAAIGVAEYLDARIRTRADVEKRLGLAYLGAVPELGTTTTSRRRAGDQAPQDYLLAHPQSKFTEGVRALKNAILLQPGGTPRSTVAQSPLRCNSSKRPASLA